MVGYVNYFSSQADAENVTIGNIGGSPGFIGTGGGPITAVGGFTAWKIANSSTGSDSQVPIYNVGNTLTNDGTYFLYPATICFLEGSKILCNVNSVDTYLPVEELRKGTLVKTKLDGYKAVELIGKSTIQNAGNDERIESRLYK